MGLFDFISDALISTITTNTSSSSQNKPSPELLKETIPSMITARVVQSSIDSLKNPNDESIYNVFARNKINREDYTKYASAGFIAVNIDKTIVNNFIQDIDDTVSSPAIGSIVYCDLACVLEHSGVYVGGGNIVHLDGNGLVNMVSFAEFLSRLDGMNPAFTIYASCLDTMPVGNHNTALRAMKMIGTRMDYDIVSNNCHKFTSGCITGNFENYDILWRMLKYTTETKYPANCWRALPPTNFI